MDGREKSGGGDGGTWERRTDRRGRGRLGKLGGKPDGGMVHQCVSGGVGCERSAGRGRRAEASEGAGEESAGARSGVWSVEVPERRGGSGGRWGERVAGGGAGAGGARGRIEFQLSGAGGPGVGREAGSRPGVERGDAEPGAGEKS